MNNRIHIVINQIDDLKKFVVTCSKFESDINMLKGSYVIDAKSLMGIMSIDTSNGVDVEIISEDAVEIEKFINEMNNFQEEV